MKKCACNFILILITTAFSTGLSSAELNRDYYNGLQLAWVLIPPTSTTEKDTEVVKPKPKSVPASKPAPKPTTVPAPQPAQAPTSKPDQAPIITKPAVVPVIQPLPTPASKPAQTPTPNPLQVLPVAKPAPKPAVKANQPFSKKAHEIEWLVGLGADFGGGELGKITYSDGSTALVNANKGVAFYFGVILPNGSESDFSTQLTLGYKLGGPRGTNGDATWSAIPLELIEYYRVSSLRMGLGISYQINPQLSVNFPASSYVDKYNNAIGLIAQIGWAPVKEHFSVDLRYTSIKFQGDNVQGPANVDGNVFGIYTSYRF